MLVRATRTSKPLKRQKTLAEYCTASPASQPQKASTSSPELVERDLGDGCWLLYHPRPWPADEVATLTEALTREVDWKQRNILVLGNYVPQPRLVAYQASELDLYYTYARVQLQPALWTPAVLRVKKMVEELTGATYNSCLMNLYRDGKDKMSWHSDNEPLYGPEPTIASVSFGSPRDFVLRNIEDTGRKVIYPLGAGAVLVMGGKTQNFWVHAVPKRASCSEMRMSLTFRNIIYREQPAREHPL